MYRWTNEGEDEIRPRSARSWTRTALTGAITCGDIALLGRVFHGHIDGLSQWPIRDVDFDAHVRTNPSPIVSVLFKLEPLHAACASGQRDMATFLVLCCGHRLLRVQDARGATALHTCARFGEAGIALDLLGFGIPPDSRDCNGCTALHVACEHNNVAVVKILLQAGSSVNARDNNGCTALFTAVRAGGSVGLLQLLIAGGVEIDAAPDGEPTSLALAAGMGRLETVKILAGAGANLSAAAKNLAGETALHLAARNGSKHVLRLLLAAGCHVQMRDTDGRTPLASACAGGRICAARLLLTGQDWCQEHVPEAIPTELQRHVLDFLVASPEAIDNVGNTALLAACEHRGTPELLELLAAQGADFSRTNARGETALHVACRTGNASLANFLLNREHLQGAPGTSCDSQCSTLASDARGRKPGEVFDIDVGVHETVAIQKVLRRYHLHCPFSGAGDPGSSSVSS